MRKRGVPSAAAAAEEEEEEEEEEEQRARREEKGRARPLFYFPLDRPSVRPSTSVRLMTYCQIGAMGRQGGRRSPLPAAER